jgi:hypothetical protein
MLLARSLVFEMSNDDARLVDEVGSVHDFCQKFKTRR